MQKQPWQAQRKNISDEADEETSSVIYLNDMDGMTVSVMILGACSLRGYVFANYSTPFSSSPRCRQHLWWVFVRSGQHGLLSSFKCQKFSKLAPFAQ